MTKSKHNPLNQPENYIVNIVWLTFIFSMVFLADIKHVRYKLIGMEFSIIILMVLYLWSKLKYNLSYKFQISDTMFGVFIIYMTVLYFVAPSRPLAAPQLNRFIFSAFAYFLARYFMSNRFRIVIADVLICFSSLIAIYAILQHYGGVWIIQVPQMNRVFATFGNPNFFASFIASIIPLAILRLYNKKTIINFILLLLLSISLYFTYTRGAWLGLLLTLFFWIISVMKKKKKLYTLLFFLILTSVFGFFTRAQWLRSTERLLIWRDTLSMFKASPVLGVGLGRFHAEFRTYVSADLKKILPSGKFIVNYAHNEYLEILSETGILGFSLYIVFIFMLLYKVLKRQKHVEMAYMFSALSVFIHSFVSVNMRFGVSSILAFFLVGMSSSESNGELENSNRLIVKSKKKYLMIPVIIIAVYFIKIVMAPIYAQKQLKHEVDFFDKPNEYNAEELKKELVSDPDRALNYYKLAWEQAKRRDFDNAIENFNRSLELDPTLVGAANNLGNIYYTIGRVELAVRYYIKAIEIEPKLTDAHFNLGFIYFNKGMLKEAAEQFNIVLKQDPNNYKAKIMLEKMVQ